MRGNQKMIEEAPAPCLTPSSASSSGRRRCEIVRLIGFRGVGTIEFMGDLDGHFYFTEIKPRIQIEHTVTEMISSVDLVREQIRLAAGERCPSRRPMCSCAAMPCRAASRRKIRGSTYMPSPGTLRRVRLPTGHGVRVDTYAYSGCVVPAQYDPIVAKVMVWGHDRDGSVRRLQRALSETGADWRGDHAAAFSNSSCSIPISSRRYITPKACAANCRKINCRSSTRAIWRLPRRLPTLRRNLAGQPSVPDRLQRGWHRSSRRLPS